MWKLTRDLTLAETSTFNTLAANVESGKSDILSLRMKLGIYLVETPRATGTIECHGPLDCCWLRCSNYGKHGI